MMREYDVKNLKREEKAKVYEQVAIETMLQKKAWDSSASLEEAIKNYNELSNKLDEHENDVLKKIKRK